MCYSLAEALWHVEQGTTDDIVVAYPTADHAALRRLAAEREDREQRLLQAVTQKKFADAYAQAKQVLADDPNNVKVLIPLGSKIGVMRKRIRMKQQCVKKLLVCVHQPHGFFSGGLNRLGIGRSQLCQNIL